MTDVTASAFSEALRDRYRIEREFILFAVADDPHVYAYVGVTYLSEIFTADGVR